MGLAMVLVAPMAFANADEDAVGEASAEDAAASMEAVPEEVVSTEPAAPETPEAVVETTEPAVEAESDVTETTEPAAETTEPAAPETTEPAAEDTASDVVVATESVSEETVGSEAPEVAPAETTSEACVAVGDDFDAVALKAIADVTMPGKASFSVTLNDGVVLCDSITLNASSFAVPSTWDGNRFNESATPQTSVDHEAIVLTNDARSGSASLDLPDCGPYQVDLYTGERRDTITWEGRLGADLVHYRLAQGEDCPTAPAAFCPGIDDDTDYRELFSYAYFAVSGDTVIALGSTVDWTDQVKVEQFTEENPDAIENMMIRATVTVKDGVDLTTGENCSYDFSLASYEAEGATWETSGDQTFLDHDTDTITAEDTSIVLEVARAECYGQSDLYTGSTVYDGDNTPRYPNGPISGNGEMIASWIGGSECVEPTEPASPEPTEPTDEPTEPTEEPTEPASPEPTEPTEEPTEPASPEPSESGSPTPTPSATTQPPSAQPSVQPTSTPTRRTAVLAETGTEVTTIAMLGGLLLLGGGGLVAAGTGGGRRKA